jgi:hypothetical protein
MLRRLLCCLTLLILMPLFAQRIAAQTEAPTPPTSMKPAAQLIGRWRVKFTFTSRVEKNLIFVVKANGSGSFLMLDTEPGDKPLSRELPAVWSQLTNDRVSFSGEVELPIGTCCREIGTLIFKGRFASDNSVTGKLIFVTSVDEEENPYQFRSLIGAFTATRLSNDNSLPDLK